MFVYVLLHLVRRHIAFDYISYVKTAVYRYHETDISWFRASLQLA